MLTLMHHRSYDFERCFNFRDLGGYAGDDGRHVAWRKLFRSMTPQFMPDDAVARVRDDLLVRNIVDLRRETSAKGGPFDAEPFRRRIIPFSTPGLELPPDTPRDHFMLEILRRSGPQTVEAIDYISQGLAKGAVLVHCHTGKDRTGVLAAVLLRLLGVSEEDVLCDFAMSADGVGAMKAYAAAQGLAFFPEIPDTAPAYVREEPRDWWLRPSLQWLEKGGGVRSYLMEGGASNELLERFREQLLRS
jgi:protein-tyrosine phosphatase